MYYGEIGVDQVVFAVKVRLDQRGRMEMWWFEMVEVIEKRSVCKGKDGPREEEKEEEEEVRQLLCEKRGGWCFSTEGEKSEANDDNKKNPNFINRKNFG